jgi:hypothetical protein
VLQEASAIKYASKEFILKLVKEDFYILDLKIIKK